MVIPTLECPNITCKVLGRIFPSIHLVAIVCLNTCIENLRIPALSHNLNSVVSYAEFFVGSPFRFKNTNSEKSILITFNVFNFSFCAFNILIASSVKGTSLYPDWLFGSPILHSPTECRYSIDRRICTTFFSKSMSDHLRPIISPVLSPVCNINAN